MHAKGEFPSPDPMSGNKNPLIPDMELNTRNMHLVEAKHVDPKDKKGTVDLSSESLGFFSIVVSYAKAAANGKVNPDKGYVFLFLLYCCYGCSGSSLDFFLPHLLKYPAKNRIE